MNHSASLTPVQGPSTRLTKTPEATEEFADSK
jgi:hypothetical protein